MAYTKIMNVKIKGLSFIIIANGINYFAMNEKEEINFKINFIGDQNVGKTCILRRFIDKKFIEGNPETFTIDFPKSKLKLYKERNFFFVSLTCRAA